MSQLGEFLKGVRKKMGSDDIGKREAELYDKLISFSRWLVLILLAIAGYDSINPNGII